MRLLTKKKIINSSITLMFGAILIFGIPVLEQKTAPSTPVLAPTNSMSVNFFDVGQGDAILAQEGEGQILIDGGPDEKILEKLSAVMPAGDRQIELLVLTHPHSDHLNGLVAVLERYKVNKILTTGVPSPTIKFEKWKALIAEKNIPLSLAQVVGEEKVGGMNFSVLYAGDPQKVKTSIHNGNSDGLNDSSIVGVLEFGNRRFLFTGDVTTKIEDLLVTSGINLDSDVLKIGHHGSNYSTGELLFKSVSPEYAIVSVGAKNSFGHPAWRVTELIKNSATIFYRTDLNGTVTAVTNGESLQIVPEKIK